MEIDEIIRAGISEGAKSGVPRTDFYWSPEDFLRLGKFATDMKWGVQYMGVNHFLKDVQVNNSSREDTQV